MLVMYIYITKDQPVRLFLVKERDENHSVVLESLGVNSYDKFYVSDIDIEALRKNKIVVIEVTI